MTRSPQGSVLGTILFLVYINDLSDAIDGLVKIFADDTKVYHAIEVSTEKKIRNRYNQVPHLTQDTNGKVTNSQIDTTNESQEVSPFLAGDHNALINRRAQIHSKHKTEKIDTPELLQNDVSKSEYWGGEWKMLYKSDKCHHAGRIQDFLIEGSNLQGGLVS